MMARWLTILFFLNLWINTASASDLMVPFIFGGTEVTAESPLARQNVLLEAKMMRVSFTCSAVILNEQVLLTATHCLGGNGWADIVAHFTLDRKKSGVRIKVVDRAMVTWPLPTTPTDRDDLALLKLEAPVPQGYEAVKIWPTTEIFAGDEVILAGYGQSVNHADDNQTGLGVLRSVNQTILEFPYGQREVRISIEERGACFGDSGGPAYIQKEDTPYLFAIASRLTARNKIRDGEGRRPAEYACLYDIIYTQVHPHLNWINQTLISWNMKPLTSSKQ